MVVNRNFSGLEDIEGNKLYDGDRIKQINEGTILIADVRVDDTGVFYLDLSDDERMDITELINKQFKIIA